MGRPTLTERRKAQTRREIAETALALFAREGYDGVSAETIAEEAGISLRTFYRYFTGKDAVLSPIVTDGIDELTERLAARPAPESLATALHNAYEEITPQQGEEGVRVLICLFLDVPALRAQWLEDLRKIEAALIPVVHKRARRPLTDYHAELSAAAAVTGLRVALEHAARSAPPASPADALRDALAYLRDGAKL
jgi:AcrR family transcriptional regulator